MRDAMRIRLKEVDQQEVERKAKFAAEAKSYLDTLYAVSCDRDPGLRQGIYHVG